MQNLKVLSIVLALGATTLASAQLRGQWQEDLNGSTR